MHAAEHWFRRPSSQPPTFNRVLIVDDNDYYADKLRADVLSRGQAEIVRARDAAEGLEILAKDFNGFDCIITDLTMESQLAGMKVISHANKHGFAGTLAVATTGIDNRFSFNFNLLVFGYLYRTDYMIPKRAIKRDNQTLWITPPGSGRLQLRSKGTARINLTSD